MLLVEVVHARGLLAVLERVLELFSRMLGKDHRGHGLVIRDDFQGFGRQERERVGVCVRSAAVGAVTAGPRGLVGYGGLGEVLAGGEAGLRLCFGGGLGTIGLGGLVWEGASVCVE